MTEYTDKQVIDSMMNDIKGRQEKYFIVNVICQQSLNQDFSSATSSMLLLFLSLALGPDSIAIFHLYIGPHILLLTYSRFHFVSLQIHRKTLLFGNQSIHCINLWL